MTGTDILNLANRDVHLPSQQVDVCLGAIPLSLCIRRRIYVPCNGRWLCREVGIISPDICVPSLKTYCRRIPFAFLSELQRKACAFHAVLSKMLMNEFISDTSSILHRLLLLKMIFLLMACKILLVLLSHLWCTHITHLHPRMNSHVRNPNWLRPRTLWFRM